MAKIGRNDPCPCGSGKKIKKCHGSPFLPKASTEPNDWTSIAKSPLQLPGTEACEEITPELRIMQAEAIKPKANPDFIHQFGQVRPPISADYLGYKFVVAGNKVLYQPKEKAQFFTDILPNFVQNTFGKEWFDAEVAKPRGPRHPAFEARYRSMSYMNAQPRDAQEHRIDQNSVIHGLAGELANTLIDRADDPPALL